MTEKVFGECRRFLEAEKKWIKRRALVLALCLRLEGSCSIGAISQILKRFGCANYNSVGWVSGSTAVRLGMPAEYAGE